MRKFREMIFSGGNKGFTLIELLVVIAVLGILAGIAVPRITGVRDRADLAAAQSSASTLRNSLEMFYALEGKYPVISSTTDSSINSIANLVSSGAGVDVSFEFNDSDATVSGSSDADGYDFTIKVGEQTDTITSN